MTWSRGREVIERLLEQRELEEIPFNQDLVDSLMSDAKSHISSANLIKAKDRTGAFELAYDAMRKAGAALLAARGLRATSSGGHIAVQDALAAQFGGPKRPFSSFNQIRRQRHDLEYPDNAGPGVDEDDVAFALKEVKGALDFAREILDSGKLTLFR